jgi:hypothetical protein
MGLFFWLDDEDEELSFDDAEPIESASDGRVIVAGRLRELDPPVPAPSDGAPCAWYLGVAESLPLDALAQPTRGMQLSRRVGVRCLLDDGTGLAIVDLSAARFRGTIETHDLVELGGSAHAWVGDLREEAGHPRVTVDAIALHEARVSFGDEVVIEGQGSWTTEIPSGLPGVGGGYRSAPRVLVVSTIRRALSREAKGAP